MKPRLSYVICTTPRSGSWMLCSILRQMEVAGRPAEFFGPSLREEFIANQNLLKLPSVTGFMDAVRAYGTGKNGVLGVKLLANQTEIFMRRASTQSKPYQSLKTGLEAEFPNLRYVWLRRENKVAQAISFYRALLTQTWILYDRQVRPNIEVPYDRFAIQRCYQEIALSDMYWERFFKAHDMDPVVVMYEELLAQRERAIQHLLRYLDLPADVPIPEPRTIKLSNGESKAWEEEFRRTDSIPHVPYATGTWAPF